MGVRVRDGIMELEVLEAHLDYDDEVYDALTHLVDGERVPRLLYAEVYDDPVAGSMLYPPMLLRSVQGDADTGLTIRGVGIGYVLGSDGVGPLYRDREFVSGNNLLDNGAFPTHLELLYWEAAEDTGWQHDPANGRTAAGSAYTATNPGKDDPLSSRKYQCEPGQQFYWFGYLKRLTGALGRIRLRLTFHGRFTPANIFPSIDADAWDIAGQVSNNPDATEDAFEVVGPGQMRARTPFPIRQLVLNPRFADGVDGLDRWFASEPRWVVDSSGAPDVDPAIHYEGSGFITPDVVITNGSDVLTSATADWVTATPAVGMLVEGPDIPPYSYVLGVSAPGTLQISQLATADHLAGDQAVAFRPNTASRAYFTTDATNSGNTLSQYAVTTGEAWNLYCHAMKTDNANGTATVSFAKVKTATADHLAGVFWEQVHSISTGGPMVLSTAVEPNVRVITGNTTIEEGTTHLGVFVDLERNTDGRWWFTNFLLQRVLGNRDWLRASDPLPVTSERTYLFEMVVIPDPNLVKEARTRLLVHLEGGGRAPITLASSDIGPLKDGETATPVLTLSVTPPSGYDTATAELVIEDTFNGYFTYGELVVRDQDRTTVVHDHITGHTQATWLLREIGGTAPVGTESVSVSVVAEGLGWLADDLVFVRFGVTPSTHTDVIGALLADPDIAIPTPHPTGSTYAITDGTILDPGVLPYDIRLINMIAREILDYLCGIVASPTLEWRINTDSSLDVGPAEDLFTPHPLAWALLPEDLDVLRIEGAEMDVEGRASRILVLGAEVPKGGRTQLIEATAEVVDGESLNRTRIVQDATVDNLLLAQARADDEALLEARPPLTVTVRLNELDAATATALGIPARPAIKPGEWVPVYKPDAHLEGTEEVTIRGRTVQPRTVRVLRRQRSIDKGRIVMRRPDGSTFPLTVNWDPAETVLTLGDRLRPWQADPQGVAAGVQYLDDRRRRPR